MRPFVAMVVANLKMNVRNRAALFWNLAFPLLFILIFGLVGERVFAVNVTVGVAGAASPYRELVVATLAANGAITLRQGETESEISALRDGSRQIVLVFANEPEPVGGGIPGVSLYYDAADAPTSQLAVGAVRQVLLELVGPTNNAVAITERPLAGESTSFIDAFVPGIVAMALMNSGVIGLSTGFVVYRERGILRRIKLTPFPLPAFLLARVASQLVIAAAQALILVGVGWLLFGLEVRGNPLTVGLTVIVGALAFLAIGFAISGIARTVETAASYANLVTFPMLFLSGIFFSLDQAPTWLKPLIRLLPLPYLVDALRGTMTGGQGLGAIWPDLVVLLATAVIALVVAVRFFRWDAAPD